jgi:hypothetical protein
MINKRNYHILFCFIGGFLYAVIFFLPFIFETNDDNKMMMLVSGSHSGTPEGYAVFLHPLLSEFLAGLYKLTTNVPWYPLLWFVFFYLAYLAWVKVVFKKTSSKPIRLLFVLAFLSFALQSLFYLQFTVVAGVLGFSGILLILIKYQGVKISNHEMVLGYFLCLLSILVRKESFFLFAVGYSIIAFLEFGLKRGVKILWNERRMIGVIVLLLVFTPVYENLKGYQNYVEFNTARSKLLDHPVLYNLEVDQDLQPDLYFFKNWYFRDNPAIDINFLVKWKNKLDTLFLEQDHVKHSLNFFWSESQNNKFISYLGLLYLCMIFATRGTVRKKVAFLSIWTVVIFILNYFYLVHARVQSLIVLQILGITVFLYREAPAIKLGNRIILTALFLLGSLFHVRNIYAGIAERSIKKQALEELVVYIPENGTFFMDWRSWNVRHLDPKTIQKHDKRMFSLGWDSYHPADILLLKSKGYDNLRDISEFYYLHSVEEERLILPNYMMYLKDKAFKSTVVAKNQFFELIYFN